MRRQAQASRPAFLQQGRIVMSAITTAPIDKLVRLIGPQGPILVTIGNDEGSVTNHRRHPPLGGTNGGDRHRENTMRILTTVAVLSLAFSSSAWAAEPWQQQIAS